MNLIKAIETLIQHSEETYPHFESERGQTDIKNAKAALQTLRYLSDEQAEEIGRDLAIDFELKRVTSPKVISEGGSKGWETQSGWFTNKGIARRAMRIILEGVEEVASCETRRANTI